MKHLTKNKKIILLIVLLLLIGCGLFLWNQSRKNHTESNPADPSIQADKDSAEQFDDNLQQHKANSSNTSGGSSDSNLKVANVVITSNSDANEIRGFITNVTEEGGECSALLSKGSEQATRSSKAFLDVNKTVCEPISTSGLAPGTWSLKLEYKSSSAKGASEVQTIRVP